MIVVEQTLFVSVFLLCVCVCVCVCVCEREIEKESMCKHVRELRCTHTSANFNARNRQRESVRTK